MTSIAKTAASRGSQWQSTCQKQQAQRVGFSKPFEKRHADVIIRWETTIFNELIREAILL